MKRLIIILFICMLIIPIGIATDYYYSQTGNDTNDCSTPALACKTIADLNGKSPSAGDNILFKCGDVWRLTEDDWVDLDHSGSSSGYIVYTGYGTCNEYNKPLFLGSWNLSSTSNWTDAGSNLWNVSGIPNDIGTVVVNNEDSFLKKEFSKTATNTQGDFYWNGTYDVLWVYSTSNPATYYDNIEASTVPHYEGDMFSSAGYDYLNFTGLAMKYGGQGAFNIGDGGSHIIIRNNDMKYFGGVVQSGTTRYGNCIGASLATHEIYVGYNNISQCLDACISPQAWLSAGTKIIANHTYEYNIAEYCTYGFEYFSSASSSTTSNVKVDHNTFTHLGEGISNYPTLGENRLDRTPVDTTNFNFTNNIVSGVTNVVMMLGDGGDWYGNIYTNYNLYFNSTGTDFISWNTTEYNNLSDFKAAVGQEANSVEGNPLFITGTYQPNENSSACNMSSSGSYVGALPCASGDSTNSTPTTPTTITANSGTLNATYSGNIIFQCTGSTDAESDTITYVIEALI